MFRLITTLWIPLFLLSFVAAAAAAEEPTGVRYKLFNGENLDGWRVTGCQAGVEDGLLVIQEGDGLVRSDHQYRDFVLELDWRPRREEKWDSGIYIRSELPPEGKPWPKRYQINLKQGDEGNLIGVPEAKSSGLIKPGQWNHFKLTAIGPRAELEINGQPAWKTDQLEAGSGYIAIQVETPGGGQFEFRDMFVTELGYQPLFNGTDLAGWEGAGAEAEKCWKVADGLLMCTGEKGPWLRSKEQFGDFNLRLQYKLLPGGNSGLYVRVPEDGNHHGAGAGVEVQILDDSAERYAKLEDYQYCGSVYKIAPANEHVGLPPERWNTMEIDCAGPSYRVTHNGVVIVDATVEQFPELAERRLEGFLGLQNHSEEVRFRNLRIGSAMETAGHDGKRKEGTAEDAKDAEQK